MLDLFADAEPWQEPLAPGAVILRRFALSRAAALLAGIEEVTAVSPFRHMVTPGGYTMSVAMANCGELGWATNERGYLYAPNDPRPASRGPRCLRFFRLSATRLPLPLIILTSDRMPA